MHPNSRLLPLFSILCGLLGAGLLYYHNGQRERLLSQPEEVAVVLSALPEGSRLTRDRVGFQKVPRRFVPKGAVLFAELEKVTGRACRIPLSPGQMIFWNALEKPGSVGGFVEKLEKGERALTLRLDRNPGIESHLKAGARIDLLATFSGGREGVRKTRTLLQNIPVLGLEDGRNGPSTVTLRVDPAQAELITFAESVASLRLSLRGAGDETVLPALPEVDFGDLADTPAPQRQAHAKPHIVYN